MNARNAVLLAVLLCATNAMTAFAATRCDGPDHKVLYLDDDVTCPTGYRNTGEPGGTLSIIGKTAVTRQQEEAYLRRHDVEARQLQQASAREQQMTIAAENNRRSNCTMLFNQLRQNDLAMRQGNAWDNMAQLKANRQAIVNQRGQLGC